MAVGREQGKKRTRIYVNLYSYPIVYKHLFVVFVFVEKEGNRVYVLHRAQKIAARLRNQVLLYITYDKQ